jgi:hypothetical protein
VDIDSVYVVGIQVNCYAHNLHSYKSMFCDDTMNYYANSERRRKVRVTDNSLYQTIQINNNNNDGDITNTIHDPMLIFVIDHGSFPFLCQTQHENISPEPPIYRHLALDVLWVVCSMVSLSVGVSLAFL